MDQYHIWDTSERPAKLIAEINVAQSKSRTGSSTAAAEATMKKDSLEASFDSHAMAPAIPSMPSAPMDTFAAVGNAGNGLGSLAAMLDRLRIRTGGDACGT